MKQEFFNSSLGRKSQIAALLAILLLCMTCKKNSHTDFSRFLRVTDTIRFSGNGPDGYIVNTVTGERLIEHVNWIYRPDSQEEELVFFASGGFRGYFSRRNGRVVVPADTYVRGYVFSEGVAAVVSKDSIVSFIDRQGHRAMTKTFKFHHPHNYVFNGGYCAVPDSSGKVGLIDHQGNWAVKPQYDWVTHIRDSLWFVQSGDKYGLLGSDLKEILPTDYLLVKVLDKSSILVGLDDYTMQVMDFNGKVRYPSAYSNVNTLCDADMDDEPSCMEYVTFGGRRGLIASDGRPLTNPDYTDISSVSTKLYRCELAGSRTYVLLNNRGNVVSASHSRH